MKKFFSIVLAAGICFSQCNFSFANNVDEKMLISIKSKINITDEMTEFKTFSEQNGNDVFYGFEWSDSDDNQNIYVNTDSDGHILSYTEYKNSWYTSENYGYKIDENFTIAKPSETAKNGLEKIVPELFENNGDKFVMLPYDDYLHLNERSEYIFTFERIRNGAAVKNNFATVSVRRTQDGCVLTSAHINWDYDAEFVLSENAISSDSVKSILSEKFPPTLAYRKNHDGEYLLEYVSNDEHYIDSQNAEEIKEDEDTSSFSYSNTESKEDASAGGSTFLTGAEVKEIEKTKELKSKDELISVLLSISELDIHSIDKEKINSRTYKSDNKYYTQLFADELDSAKPLSDSINALFDAQNGELLIFNRYSRDMFQTNAVENDEQTKESSDNAYTFINKYFKDKAMQCERENVQNGVICKRKVNDVEYSENRINAYWDNEHNRISSFASEWDDDISAMPKPENILSPNEVFDKMIEKYPIEKIYIKSDGKYIECFAFSETNVKINAFNGKIVDWSGKEIKEKSDGIYSDCNGHWVENIAKKLAEYGIAEESDMLRPDEEITQAEFLKFVNSAINGFYNDYDTDLLYKRMNNLKILSEKDNAPDEKINRENAVCCLLRAMNINEVAEINGIYICDFEDNKDISADKIGYCAIAKGFGIIQGSNGYLRPRDNITRAEALVMLYNYFTR